MGGPGQRTNIGEGRIGSRKLSITVGRHCDAIEGLVVQRVGERQRDGGRLIVPVIAGVSGTWHDATADLGYGVVVLRRTTVYRVIPSECRVTIASISGDRAAAKARRQHSAEVHMQREPDSRVPV